jgi:hypothetical protein
MAFITASHTDAALRPSWIVRTLRAIGDFFVSYAEARSRSERVEAMLRLTDNELAARGLTRNGIVQHVFSDKFYL